jgi:hypothetical protein
MPIDQTQATGTILWRESEWGMNSFLPDWQRTQGDIPVVYSVAATPPITMQLAPIPGNGWLELETVDAGAALTLNGVTLGIPDDWVWALKWGVLADLLSRDAEAKDAERAAYCEQRYRAAVEAAGLYPSVIQLFVNNIRVPVNSVFDMDAYSGNWEDGTSNYPTIGGIMGRNLLALYPSPTGYETVVADMVAPIPIPTSDGDTLQIPPDVIPVLLDYAQHLASFKMGGDEFNVTAQQFKNLIIAAAEYNSRLKSTNFYNMMVSDTVTEQTEEVPRMTVSANNA